MSNSNSPRKLSSPILNEKGPFDLIGDVHGCFDELHALLIKLGYHIQKKPATW